MKVVSVCPRIEYVKTEFELNAIASDGDFSEVSKAVQKVLHAPSESANEWLKAAMQGETSCGRERYGQKSVCHACYASQIDTRESHRRYNSSDKGKSRLAAYRSKKKPQPKTVQALTLKRRDELAARLESPNNLDLSVLTQRQAEIFTMYYGIGREPMTLEAIAKEFNCKKQNVAQLRNYALKNLLKQDRAAKALTQ